MPSSTNLALPYIDANQNQKYVTHNTALRILDALAQIQVQSAALTAPPASPSDGQVWIVASGGTGAWLGKDLQLAAWQDGAWAFYPPRAGYIAYNVAVGSSLMWTGTTWSSLLGTITSLMLSTLGIGTAPDSSNPLSVTANAALFSAKTTGAGGTGDMRVKLSKQAASNTASFLFQDNFSGRAEIGLTGDDNFHFKVSAGGSSFVDGLTIDRTTGAVTLGNSRTPVANTNYTALVTDRLIAYTALTVSRTVTLPAASAYPAGNELIIADESGAASAARTITINAAGSDTINGAASDAIALPFGFEVLVCDGSSKWMRTGQTTASMAQQDAANVAITGGAIDGAVIGGTTPAAVNSTLFSTTSASGTAGTPNKLALTFTNFGLGLSPGSLDICSNGNVSFYRAGSLNGQVTSTGLNALAVGTTTASTVRGTTVTATTSVNLPSYTVATLPAAGTAGRLVFASNARVSGQGAGAGTGSVVSDNGTAWQIVGTNVTAVA